MPSSYDEFIIKKIYSRDIFLKQYTASQLTTEVRVESLILQFVLITILSQATVQILLIITYYTSVARVFFLNQKIKKLVILYIFLEKDKLL